MCSCYICLTSPPLLGDDSTVSDQCFNGICRGVKNLCFNVTCDVTRECVDRAFCDPVVGSCQNVFSADGSMCSKGACRMGECLPDPCDNCTTTSTCVEATCSLSDGCDFAFKQNGTVCVTPANSLGSCISGTCVAPKDLCEDVTCEQQQCFTAPTCDSRTGVCFSSPTPGTPCNDNLVCDLIVVLFIYF